MDSIKAIVSVTNACVRRCRQARERSPWAEREGEAGRAGTSRAESRGQTPPWLHPALRDTMSGREQSFAPKKVVPRVHPVLL